MVYAGKQHYFIKYLRALTMMASSVAQRLVPSAGRI